MKRISSRAAIGIAAATLFVGYSDLWRGGETISAILLTAGYLIIVPIAIMTVPRRNRTHE